MKQEYEQAMLQAQAAYDKYRGEAPDFKHWLAYQHVVSVKLAFAYGEAQGSLDVARKQRDEARAELERISKRWVAYKAHVRDCGKCQDGYDCFAQGEALEGLFVTLGAVFEDRT